MFKHRSRLNYWSLGCVGDWVRGKFGLTSPKAMTMDEWDEYHVLCKNKSRVGYWISNKGLNHIQDICLLPSDIWWFFTTADTWKFFRNLWKFKKSLWHYRSYDYSGLLLFMEAATKDMHECHKNHGHLMRSEETAKELLIVSTLLKRIREDNYTDEVQGWEHKEGNWGGSFYQKPNTLPSIDAKDFYKMREAVKKNDLDLVCKMMKTKLFTWWD